MSMLPDDPESTILKRLKKPKPEDQDAPDTGPDQRSELLTQPRTNGTR
jgi:membrane protein required for colicin V production